MPVPFIDPETGFSYPGPVLSPFEYTATATDLEEALRTMILSASGWRKVYAADGDEENPTPEVRPVDRILALGMAATFVSFLNETTRKDHLRVAVGLDARFTGPVLADAMVRILLAQGVEVDYLGIVAAPEIMAWVQTAGRHDGFIYVSASHNPIGHNGVKFGLGNGGVVGGAPAATLIAEFRAVATNAMKAAGWIAQAQTVGPASVEAVLTAMGSARAFCRAAYASLCDQILTLTAVPAIQAERRDELKALIGDRGLGVVGELNGSARGLSIDQAWLEGLGVRVKALNNRPRQFVHRIVPEGASLNLCAQILEDSHSLDASYQLGYVPDCDGDRGNIVFFDTVSGKARILEAQEVFALCVLSELAGLTYYGDAISKVAVVCNDPTSFRIDEIAGAFGAHVFRAEVGEANVVNLARSLRDDGWTVRILGEGSNGGNITFPGSVRDPLSTVGSLLKLLCLRSVGDRPGLFELWCHRSGQLASYRPDFTLTEVLATLPAWSTSLISDDRAMLRIRSLDHAKLKANFESQWVGEWERNQAALHQRFGISHWEEVNFEGTAEKPGFGPGFRSRRQTGGLKIVLKDSKGQVQACLWMRGSGTEPVFRILTEVRGNAPAGQLWLLEWLTKMVQAADS